MGHASTGPDVAGDPQSASSSPIPRWRSPETVAAVATITQSLIAAAAGWFLLLQLAPIIRPLLVAILLAYVLMPYHSRLRKRLGTPASLVLLASATATILLALAFATYVSILDLNEDLPRLQNRAVEMIHQVERTVGQAYGEDGKSLESRLTEQAAKAAGPALNVAAEIFLEACVVVLYLMFLLLEASRLPDRVRRAYPPERADAILKVAGEVNAAVVSYLKAKVKASLALAAPVGLVLWVLGVKFALLWAILTFLCNFIPYVGSVVAYFLPVGFAFLLYGVSWESVATAVLLLVCHAACASVVEPMMLGKAVGLSPLVIVGSLAFWGLLWGMPGMFLAVPLTVVAMIVMDHFEQTQPVARFFRGG